MSGRLIEWNGKRYDVDPAELTMGEFEEIAKRGGPDGYREMVVGLRDLKPTAWKSLFWIQDYRDDPSLSFGDYAGPTYRVILDGFDKLPEPEGPGKAQARPSDANGSEPSPTPSDTPPTSSTG